MPANTRRDKASRVLLKLLTEVKERADTIDTEEGNKVRFMEDAVKEEHTRAVGSSSRERRWGKETLSLNAEQKTVVRKCARPEDLKRGHSHHILRDCAWNISSA